MSIVRFWAGARRAAGVAEEPSHAATLGQLRAELSQRPALSPIVEVAAFMVDGVAAHDETPLEPSSVVDVLPPFAGG